MDHSKCGGLDHHCHFCASGRSKVSKHEKTNQDESDYESRQPCRIESREGAKEREREMSERGSKA